MIPASETYEQWCDRLAANRKARIEAEPDPVRREGLKAVDAACRSMDRAVEWLSASELNN